jgi:uncharacterized protein (DUF58 family)
MQLLPTARAIHLTVAGFACMAFGAAVAAPEINQIGGAIVLGLLASRAFSYLSVARARVAGFEMLWRTDRKLIVTTRLEQLELWVELQNRDTKPTEFRNLVALAGPGLEVMASPCEGTIEPCGSMFVRVLVTPERVGVHGIFGVSLETIRAPGLFHAPLVFSNSLVLEVQPRHRGVPHAAVRARRMTVRNGARPSGGVSASVGDFRELREHRPGDPYHRIAWKPSARRGKLLVIDYEVSDQETTWVLVDASQELFQGRPPSASIDFAFDTAAQVMVASIGRGSRVGLAVVGRRVHVRAAPARGSAHLRRLLGGLTLSAHTLDMDQSGWSMAELEAMVREHVHFVAPDRADKVRFDNAGFLRLVSELILKAPYGAPTVAARTAEEGVLRRYLLAYGIQSPPSSDVDRPFAERHLAGQLRALLSPRSRPSSVHIIARYPNVETPGVFLEQLALASRSGISVHFHPIVAALGTHAAGSTKGAMARDALSLLEEVEGHRALERLTQLGVRVREQVPTHVGRSAPSVSNAIVLDHRAARE